MDNRIAFCGLDCGKCDAYLATVNNDDSLRVKTAELWSELNSAEIYPEEINCEGCRGNGVKTDYCEIMCAIRQCALESKVTTCGDCPEMDSCEMLGHIIANNPDALKNLKG